MANSTVASLTAASALTGTELFYADDGTNDVKVTATQIQTFARGYSTAVTVASLPAAGTAGRRSFVSDASATTFASIVAGGGTNKVPVYDDGTNWRIG